MEKQTSRVTKGVLLMTLAVNLVTLGYSNVNLDPSAATSPLSYRTIRSALSHQGDTSNDKVDVDGEVIFGGLFPMHEKGTQGRNCGEIKKEKGIQRLEAMLLAVDLINKDPKLLPGLKVGLRILDTCSYDTFALEQCMDFIKAQLSTIDLEDYRCADDQSPSYKLLKPVAGVIGAASSTVSIMVANILRLFKRSSDIEYEYTK
ncbi:metabotropic glutamate receptor 8-like [Littorina saxatilis]|uniref:metabotropic glutamate receptor 8-like n=1 Tax=Littorina saxatilis TaxID=31220 RepID=UPI0038B43163